MGRDDEKACKEIRRDAMRGDDVVSASDGGFAAVGGKDHDGGYRGFKGAVQVCEAFNVKHVHLLAREKAIN